MGLTLKQLAEANIARGKQWVLPDAKERPGLLFSAVELSGEVGELCNAIKKWERLRLGMPGGLYDAENIADELADVLISVNLLAIKCEVDLEKAVIQKFNKTSRKHGFTVFLPEQETKDE